MKYNSQIHHRKSIRLKGYDYSQAGLYFITICCYNRECLFGEIMNGNVTNKNVWTKNFRPLQENQNQIMILNNAGKIADECWLDIPNHFPNAVIGEYIVMPNHIHGIVELKDATDVGVKNFQPLHRQHNEFQKMIPRSIGSIVKGFKIGVTKWFRNNTNVETVWQRNFYEHIIRNEQSYKNITDYIINNPSNWKEDKLFKK